jgi:Nuclear protein 96
VHVSLTGAVPSVLCPAGYTDNVLDYLMAWQLGCTLAGLGAVQGQAWQAAMEAVTVSSACQVLLATGSVKLALFVLAHVQDDCRRTAACRLLQALL